MIKKEFRYTVNEFSTQLFEMNSILKIILLWRNPFNVLFKTNHFFRKSPWKSWAWTVWLRGYVETNHFFLTICSVAKPEVVSHVDAACGVGNSVKAYTALFYQAKIQSGETILILDAYSVWKSFPFKNVIRLYFQKYDSFWRYCYRNR